MLGDGHRNSSHVPYLETVEEATDYEGILPQLPTPLFPGLFFSVDGVAQVSASMISPSGQGSEILRCVWKLGPSVEGLLHAWDLLSRVKSLPEVPEF